MSYCSRRCEKGQAHREKGFHSCCYDCVDCAAGSYQRSPGKPPPLCTQAGSLPRSAPSLLVCTSQGRCGGALQGWERTAWRGPWCVLAQRLTPRPEPGVPPAPSLPPLLWTTFSAPSVSGTTGRQTGAGAASPTGPSSWCGGNWPHCCCLCCWARRWQPWSYSSGTRTAPWSRPRACFSLIYLRTLWFPAWPCPLLHLPLAGCLSPLVLQAAEVFVETELLPSWVDWLRGPLRGPRA